MSFFSFARLNYLLIVSLLVNLLPLPHQAAGYVTGAATREMAPTAGAVPAWFAVPGNATTVGLFLPTVGPVDYGPGKSPARQLSIGEVSHAPEG